MFLFFFLIEERFTKTVEPENQTNKEMWCRNENHKFQIEWSIKKKERRTHMYPKCDEAMVES